MFLHPSGFFEYEMCTEREKGRVVYQNCLLAWDLPYDNVGKPQWPPVTFHQDQQCIQGAHFDEIIELTLDKHLYAWNGESIVMDFVYE
jgi:hypothetical protein